MRTLTTMLLATVMITLAQDKKDAPVVTQISKEDQYHLRAINAELTTIQDQINHVAEQLHAQDKVKERGDIVARVCGAAKIPVESCTIDTDTGKVSEVPKPPASAPTPATKSAK